MRSSNEENCALGHLQRESSATARENKRRDGLWLCIFGVATSHGARRKSRFLMLAVRVRILRTLRRDGV
jgi:hypothetical protein